MPASTRTRKAASNRQARTAKQRRLDAKGSGVSRGKGAGKGAGKKVGGTAVNTAIVLAQDPTQTDLLALVRFFSETIQNGREPIDVLRHLRSEVRELRSDVKAVRRGKTTGPDGIRGEAIDVALCALDLIFVDRPTTTNAEIMTIATQKCEKWATHYSTSIEKAEPPKEATEGATRAEKKAAKSAKVEKKAEKAVAKAGKVEKRAAKTAAKAAEKAGKAQSGAASGGTANHPALVSVIREKWV